MSHKYQRADDVTAIIAGLFLILIWLSLGGFLCTLPFTLYGVEAPLLGKWALWIFWLVGMATYVGLTNLAIEYLGERR